MLCLSSCGSDQTVARIEGAPQKVTRSALDHWMRILAASDFLHYLHRPAPAGLVAEPANQSECAEAAKKIARASTGTVALSDNEIASKCRQLHHVIKAQALGELIQVQWMIREGEERGVRVSDAEVRRELPFYAKRFNERAYGAQVSRHRYLSERQMTPADLLYETKHAILYQRLKLKTRAEVARIGGGLRTLARLSLGRYNGLLAKTVCKAGYVVLGCRGYREAAAVALPPYWVTLEGFTKVGG